MKGIICDLCAQPAKEWETLGRAIEQDYCKECAVKVRALYEEIDKLQEEVQFNWQNGLRRIVEKFNKRNPEGVADFHWLR
jgi:hypothetical protein